jgi:isohexenylglutaconyl-CoA hydratase
MASATEINPAVAVRRDHNVTHLTFNRPESRNAMSLAMVDELLAALAAAEQDGCTRIILLRGAGGHFCAGADLKDMAAARGNGGDAIAAVNRRFGELCAAFAASPLAVVAVIEGSVMGGGFGLACAADIALATASATFRLPETSLGLVPAQIAPYLIERLGYSQARRLAVTGGRIDGNTALQIGLVHECHTDTGALDVAVQRLIGEILACAPHALAVTKQLVARARLHSPQSLINDAAAEFSRAALGKEGTEGTMAFIQKRKPAWAPP